MRDFPEINKKLIGGITEKQTIAKGFLNVNQSVKSMEKKTAAILGASGLIGGHLLRKLMEDSEFISIRVITRRPLPIEHSKVKQLVIDFSDCEALKKSLLGCNTVFCTVGTTRKKVKGDKVAYRKVDFDIPVTAAKICAEAGIKQFLLVSSIGAESSSGNFYLKLKGEVEDVIRKLPIPSISIFRPSMLLGKRQESRPTETFGQAIMGSLSFLIPDNYKPIKAEKVANSMLAASKSNQKGLKIYGYSEMIQLSAKK
jgi:uncharacterized protein YbjT (DUF2867 family)